MHSIWQPRRHRPCTPYGSPELHWDGRQGPPQGHAAPKGLPATCHAPVVVRDEHVAGIGGCQEGGYECMQQGPVGVADPVHRHVVGCDSPAAPAAPQLGKGGVEGAVDCRGAGLVTKGDGIRGRHARVTRGGEALKEKGVLTKDQGVCRGGGWGGTVGAKVG